MAESEQQRATIGEFEGEVNSASVCSELELLRVLQHLRSEYAIALATFALDVLIEGVSVRAMVDTGDQSTCFLLHDIAQHRKDHMVVLYLYTGVTNRPLI